MDNQQQTTEQEVLQFLKNNKTFRNKIKENIKRNIDIYSIMSNKIKEPRFLQHINKIGMSNLMNQAMIEEAEEDEEWYEEKENNLKFTYKYKMPDSIVEFLFYLFGEKNRAKKYCTPDLQEIDMMCKLIECARQEVNINNEYKNKLRIINVFNFVNTVGEVSTKIKAQLKLEQQRQQAHQEQDKIDNYLTLLGKIENIKKYLTGKIQNNNGFI